MCVCVCVCWGMLSVCVCVCAGECCQCVLCVYVCVLGEGVYPQSQAVEK